MITVTDSAKEALKTALSASTEDDKIGLRLAPSAVGKYDLVLDTEQEGDQVVEYLGGKLLLIDEKVSAALDGSTLDYRQVGDTMRLVMCEE